MRPRVSESMLYETIAFVDDNGEKSLPATALAAHETGHREFDVSLVTGSVEPIERIKPAFETALAEVGVELDSRTPREIQSGDIHGVDYVVTMGCLICDFRPPFWRGPADRWELEETEGSDIDRARAQRDELTRRIESLFDDLEAVAHV